MKVYVAVLGFQGCIDSVEVYATMTGAVGAVETWTHDEEWFNKLEETGEYPNDRYDPSNAYECEVEEED